MTAFAETDSSADDDRNIGREIGLLAAQGDASVVEDIFQQYGRRLLSVMGRNFNGYPPAEDLVQDTMVNAMQAIEKGQFTYQGPNSMFNWLCKIGINRGISLRRRSGTIPQVPADFQEAVYLHPVTEDFSERVVDAIASDDFVEGLLDCTNPDFVDAVIGVDVEGLMYREYAESQGLPIGTVLSRVHRGRHAMRTAIEARPPSDF